MSDSFSFFRNDRYLFGDIEILRAVNQPCPVCGHPTGNCSGDLDKPDHIVGEDFTNESIKNDKMILVEQDIYETRQVTAFTTTNVLIHRAGTYVTNARAKELKII